MRKIGISLFALLASMALASCGGQPADTPAKESQPAQTSEKASETPASSEGTSSKAEETSNIKSLTAKNAEVELSIGDVQLLQNYYIIEGNRSLTTKDKQCTYVSDNPEVVQIVNKTMKAAGIGSATVTVTSKVDSTKSCSFHVTVKDTYFDHALSIISSQDDFTKELPENENYYVRTSGSLTDELVIKGVDAVEFSVETTMAYHSTLSHESWPKIGVFASTAEHTPDSPSNKLYYFLNVENCHENTEWGKIGACEVQNGSNWAWNPGVPDTTARHQDALYTVDPAIQVEDSITLKMIRKGFDFHFFVNGQYAASMTTLEDLFGVLDGDHYTAVPSQVGFFEFNSDVTFSAYKVNTDTAAVDAEIAAISEPAYISTWTVDDAN